MQAPRSRPQLYTGVNPHSDPTTPAVVVVQPDPDSLSHMARQLTSVGERVIGASGLGGALALLRECQVKLLIMAEEVAEGDIPQCVTAIQLAQPGCMLVVLAPEEPVSGIRPVQLDHLDYVNGPLDVADLVALLRRTASRRENR